MAATGTPTPNIGLRRPQGTDPASVDDINYNSERLDTVIGAVGNTSLSDQITTLNSNLTELTSSGSDNSYGSVSWYVWNKLVMIDINISNSSISSDWSTVANGVPAPTGGGKIFVGMNSSSTNPVALYLSGSSLTAYAPGETTVRCTICYIKA